MAELALEWDCALATWKHAHWRGLWCVWVYVSGPKLTTPHSGDHYFITVANELVKMNLVNC